MTANAHDDSPAGLPARIALHLAAALLAALAAFGIYLFLWRHHQVVGVFPHLFDGWRFGSESFDMSGLLWGAAAIALLTAIGWFYLEGHELYVPRGARLALAWAFGAGLAGVVLEWLAIPHRLSRVTIAVALGTLLGVLALRAWFRARRPPETGEGGDAGPTEFLLRRRLARSAFEASLRRPRGPFERAFFVGLVGLIGAISAVIFWHALLYPETYWDSLILYLGYARMTFLEGGFPVKVTGQVGIGLGANYPHLFPVLGAGVATVAGEWSELPQRLMAPTAGLAATLLVFHTALRMTRHINFSLAIALLYRSVPLALIWDQYASDYAFVLLFGTAFLYLALLYLETGLFGYLAASALLIALSLHLNYLMGILGGPWALMLLFAHIGWGRTGPPRPDPEAHWTWLGRRPGLWTLLGSRRLWLTLLLCAALGSTWFIRNWIVTGNPVYAFFHEHLGGIRINPEVMEAANQEWVVNGAGIGALVRGLEWPQTIESRLRAAWIYFGIWNPAYRTSPLLIAFTLGGLAMLCVRIVLGWFFRSSGLTSAHLRYGILVAALFCALLAFHFVLAPFYLYQIIKIVPCMALLVVFTRPAWRPRPWCWVFAVLVLGVGLVPGLAMSLMGWKVKKPFQTPAGEVGTQLNLHVLRHPLTRKERIYRWEFGEDVRMWAYINGELAEPGGQVKLLTHENRHLVYEPSIRLVHLDDWPMQKLWKVEDPAERVRRLVEQHDTHYYLYVPNEDATPTNQRMGADAWPELGLAELIYEAGPNRLYRLTPPGEASTSAEPRATPTPTPAPTTTPTPTPSPAPTTGTLPAAQSAASTRTPQTATAATTPALGQ